MGRHRLRAVNVPLSDALHNPKNEYFLKAFWLGFQSFVDNFELCGWFCHQEQLEGGWWSKEESFITSLKLDLVSSWACYHLPLSSLMWNRGTKSSPSMISATLMTIGMVSWKQRSTSSKFSHHNNNEKIISKIYIGSQLDQPTLLDSCLQREPLISRF